MENRWFPSFTRRLLSFGEHRPRHSSYPAQQWWRSLATPSAAGRRSMVKWSKLLKINENRRSTMDQPWINHQFIRSIYCINCLNLPFSPAFFSWFLKVSHLRHAILGQRAWCLAEASGSVSRGWLRNHPADSWDWWWLSLLAVGNWARPYP